MIKNLIKIFKSIWEDISNGKNIESYIILLFSIGLTTINLVGSERNLSIAIILASLSVLLIAALETKSLLTDLLDKESKNTKPVLGNRHDVVPFDEFSKNGTEIWVLGISCVNILKNTDFLERKLQSGSFIRVLILDPESDSIALFNKMTKYENTKADIISSLSLIKSFHSEYVKSEQMEVKLMPDYLPFSMAFSHQKNNEGQITIEYHTYMTHMAERPHLKINQRDNLEWFSFYSNQYIAAWDNAKTWYPK